MKYDELILHVFAASYPRSAMRQGGRPLRLRHWEQLLPEAYASAMEQEGFLQAMEWLEAQGLLRLGWAHRRKRDRLLWAELVDPRRLYANLGQPYPDTVEEVLRETARGLAQRARDAEQGDTEQLFTALASYPSFLDSLVSIRDMEDLYILLTKRKEGAYKGPIRSLSVTLFRDSKRLEALLGILKRLTTLCNTPDLLLGLPRRNFPVVWLAGPFRLSAEGPDTEDHSAGARLLLDLGQRSPLIGVGAPFGLSLELLAGATKLEIAGATGRERDINILTIENKETFFSLWQMENPFTAYVYTNGWPNSAVRRVLELLHRQGYRLYHAGDLDPEGLAICQYLQDHYGSRPFGMDMATFERYRPYGRPLSDPELRSRRFEKYLSRLNPPLQDLARRIQESRIGIEQEVIDYKECEIL
ncbi:DUF2399 domain-containing protein [Gracilinema caldarium]|uniref:DUF2399 domain-containing protein n=1 Tax=Gracilinema caldarium (strain ATCC 51460 / DSM 7334 / H1) TaxID=744872 RepID=F8F258_GRAC1|nr:DUF2399 domain-containing protein [Gracilinema caldarium]AEJ20330.1 hypothetical protein Spica_2212 [Gracilinema caldarium DSM 7334]